MPKTSADMLGKVTKIELLLIIEMPKQVQTCAQIWLKTLWVRLEPI